jgi:hypothetical protein
VIVLITIEAVDTRASNSHSLPIPFIGIGILSSICPVIFLLSSLFLSKCRLVLLEQGSYTAIINSTNNDG